MIRRIENCNYIEISFVDVSIKNFSFSLVKYLITWIILKNFLKESPPISSFVSPQPYRSFGTIHAINDILRHSDVSRPARS